MLRIFGYEAFFYISIESILLLIGSDPTKQLPAFQKATGKVFRTIFHPFFEGGERKPLNCFDL